MTACDRCEEDEEAMILIHHQLFLQNQNTTRIRDEAHQTLSARTVQQHSGRGERKGDCARTRKKRTQSRRGSVLRRERIRICTKINIRIFVLLKKNVDCLFSFSFFKRKFKSNLLKGYYQIKLVVVPLFFFFFLFLLAFKEKAKMAIIHWKM
jgi:hypothetical protein